MNSKISLVLALFVFSASFSCSGQKTKTAEEEVTTTAAKDNEKRSLTNGQTISVTQFADLIQNNSKLIILDVRTPQEVAEGYVEGAKKINIFDADFDEKVSGLDKNAPIAVYCKSGGRSSKAVQKMLSMGFGNVYNVSGGFTAWQAQGLPQARD